MGGFKAQGLTAESAAALIEDAKAIQDAGAFALLVEAVPPEVCKIITELLSIPVYSIGAGIHADGQLMICHDVLGIFQAFTPKFVKRYAEIGSQIESVFKEYVADIRERRFPEDKHTYSMLKGEEEKLIKTI